MDDGARWTMEMEVDASMEVDGDVGWKES